MSLTKKDLGFIKDLLNEQLHEQSKGLIAQMRKERKKEFKDFYIKLCSVFATKQNLEMMEENIRKDMASKEQLMAVQNDIVQIKRSLQGEHEVRWANVKENTHRIENLEHKLL